MQNLAIVALLALALALASLSSGCAALQDLTHPVHPSQADVHAAMAASSVEADAHQARANPTPEHGGWTQAECATALGVQGQLAKESHVTEAEWGRSAQQRALADDTDLARATFEDGKTFKAYEGTDGRVHVRQVRGQQGVTVSELNTSLNVGHIRRNHPECYKVAVSPAHTGPPAPPAGHDFDRM